MSFRQSLRLLPTLILAIFLTFNLALSSPGVGDDLAQGGRMEPPRLTPDPASFEFEVPSEVVLRDTLVLTNNSASVLRYTVTSVSSPGFVGSYFHNAGGASPQFGELILRRKDADINFNWGEGVPAEGVRADNFGVRWEGTVNVAQAGNTAFRTNTDDGVRLFVDNQRVIDDWQDHGPTDRQWTGNLAAGPHPVKMEYYDNGGGAVARLLWQPAGAQNFSVIPGSGGSPWLAYSPLAGNLAARASVNISLSIYTRGMNIDNEYLDTLRIESNDRETPVVLVPVSLLVTPWQPGILALDPDHIYRQLEANANTNVVLTMQNVGVGNYDFQTRVEGQDAGWLTRSPTSGTIPPGRQSQMTVTLNAAGRQNGVYSAVLILIGNDEQNRETRIPVTMAIGVEVGSVSGRIFDERSNDPIPGARVGLLGYGIQTLTDEQGAYQLENVPVLPYRLWSSAADYLRRESAEFNVRAGQNTEANIGLLHSEFLAVPGRVVASLAPDDTLRVPLTIRNHGNGPLSWQVNRRFPEEHQQRPFARRLRFDVDGNGVEDSRVNGAEFVDGEFYIAGGNSGNPPAKVYVYDEEGTYVRQFDQFNDNTAWGFRDLAWDGRLLWGGDGAQMYGFDLEGNLEEEFQGPINPCRGVAFDPAAGHLWVCDITSSLYALDREGRVLRTLRNPGGRKFGLAWYAADRDGFPLWMFTSEGEHPVAIQKYNPNTEELRFVIDLPGSLPADRAGGLAVTGSWDHYNHTLVALMQSEHDGVALYHLNDRTDWLRVSPEQGNVDAGGSQALTVFLDATDLPTGSRFNAHLDFSHDGTGGEAVIPIELNVSGAGGATVRTAELQIGWNLVSVNITPDGDDNFPELLAPLLEAGHLVFAKDAGGNFYWPARGFNGINSWNGLTGYWIKTSAPAQLSLSGQAIAWDTPIDLQAGWNTVSYLPRFMLDPADALSGLGENLLIARNGSGQFYLPAYNYSDIDAMSEGEGYQLRLQQAGRLVYSLGRGLASDRPRRYTADEKTWLETLPRTGTMHQILTQSDLAAGTRLEAVTPAGVVAGRGVVGTDGLAGVTLWGDDPSTEPVDGFIRGEAAALRIAATSEMLSYSVKSGEVAWIDGGLGVVQIGEAASPVEFELSSAWPNPFNGQLRIGYSLAETGLASLKAYDMSGREVSSLASGRLDAGRHQVVWNADALPSGVYLLKLESGARNAVMKVILMK